QAHVGSRGYAADLAGGAVSHRHVRATAIRQVHLVERAVGHRTERSDRHAAVRTAFPTGAAVAQRVTGVDHDRAPELEPELSSLQIARELRRHVSACAVAITAGHD